VVWDTAAIPRDKPPACPVWGQGDILTTSAKSSAV